MTRTEEYIYYNNLYDIYGNLLTEREKEIFNLYYKEDFSLSEIASLLKVSKSAIGASVGTINKKLEEYEQKLNFNKKRNQLKALYPTLAPEIDNIFD